MIPNEISVNKSIKLIRLKIGDAKVIYKAIVENRKFLSIWLPFVDSTNKVEDTEAFISMVTSNGDYRQEVFTIWYNERFCGLLGLKDLDWVNRKVELGYWLVEEMTGIGIITTCVKNIMDLCFGQLSLNRIQIKCAVGNIKSSAIPKRLGYTFEGIERDGERHPGSFFDLEIYSLLKKEWG